MIIAQLDGCAKANLLANSVSSGQHHISARSSWLSPCAAVRFATQRRHRTTTANATPLHSSSLLAFAKRSGDLARCVALGGRCAFVVILFAFRYGNLDFAETSAQIHAQWHDRIT